MNFPLWCFVISIVSRSLTFLLRKLVFVLDAAGVFPLFSKTRYCQKDLYFDQEPDRSDMILEFLKRKHFSVRKKNNGYVFFSSIFNPYPIRAEMLMEEDSIRLHLSDAHCQMMISRHQMNKFTAKINQLEREVSKIFAD